MRGSYSFERGACPGRMICLRVYVPATLSPLACGCFGRMIFHLSPICLPLVSHCLQSLAPPYLQYTGRMILHGFPTCLPSVPVHSGRSGPRDSALYTLVSHVSLLVALVSACLRLLWIHFAGVVSCLSPHYILLALAGFACG